VKIFGIDPGSQRTGYGCVERVGGRQRLIICGSLAGPPRATFPDKLKAIHAGLTALLAQYRPDCVAIEDVFHARNVRSALKLGQARGVALLAASEAGLPVVEYAPAAIKRAVVGYGRAEKQQVQHMIKWLLDWTSRRGRTTQPTRWPSRSAICRTRPERWPSGSAPSGRRRRCARGVTIDRECTISRSGRLQPARGPAKAGRRSG
jgi:crossover junction endodeoxyribonuclease RuvC